MMDETLFGMETELAFSALRTGMRDPNQATLFKIPRPLDSAVSSAVQDLLVGDFVMLAEEQLCSLRDLQARGVYLGNGSRLYLDAGRHPEFCTPECRSPEELVRWQLAGERILANLLEELTKIRPDNVFSLFRCNVDYGGTQSTWGCHESYQHRSDETQMIKHLIPHLVSRIVYTGAGGLNNRVDQAEFLISPRVPHLMHAIGGDSQTERALYHTKNEQLGKAEFSRLHLICGESNSSHLSTYLKFGTTALIVRLIDAGVCRGNELAFHRPLHVMNKYARDVECQRKCRLRNGRRRSAIQIQREYLAMVEEHLSEDFMPEWAPRVCERWRETLDQLETDPSSLSTRLDWAIKRALFEDRIGRSNTSWNDLTTGSGLGAELCEIDTRFGELGPAGLFRRLDQAGALDHRLPELGSVDDAITSPPPGGRAEVRGRAIQELGTEEDRDRYKCKWELILDQEEGRIFDMADPYGRDAEWRRAEVARRRRSPQDRFREHLVEGLSRGVSLYQGAMRTSAGETLVYVAERARSAGEHEVEALARFWCASAYHNAGRLQDAEDILEPIIDSVLENVESETACRVLTRHALVLIDRPAERVRIEAAIERARTCLDDLDRRLGRSRVGMVEARWQGALGHYDQAIETMERALEAEDWDLVSFARSSYFRWIIYYLLRTNRIDRASFYLERWRDYNEGGSSRYDSCAMLACAESLVARARGDHEMALDRARVAVVRTEDAERNRYRTSASCALIESAVAAGELETARPHVEAIEGWGNVAIGEQQCDVYLATAAFYRALGRRQESDGEVSGGAPDRGSFAGSREDAGAGAWERQAELAEQAGRNEARAMDERVGSEHRRREIGEGLRPVG
jgi:tetratricopeptide (TPR) repeat protein